MVFTCFFLLRVRITIRKMDQQSENIAWMFSNGNAFRLICVCCTLVGTLPTSLEVAVNFSGGAERCHACLFSVLTSLSLNRIVVSMDMLQLVWCSMDEYTKRISAIVVLDNKYGCLFNTHGLVYIRGSQVLLVEILTFRR